MIRLNDILDKITDYLPGADLGLVEKAYVFSAKVHKGQTRLSGEPYLVHPLEVAGILCNMKMDIASVITGMLHDTVEDTLVVIEEVEENFGEEIAFLVDGLTKISKIAFSSAEEKQAENFRKMVLAMAKDIRVIFVRLSDRLHNMRTLEFHTPENRKKIARETLDIYAPLANRLGIEWLKNELEDLSLKYQKPEIYVDLESRLLERTKEKEQYIDEVISIISRNLVSFGFKAVIEGRPKHIYSIYRKMKVQGIEFNQVYDLIAFRIILNSVKECYAALGIVHSLWKPVPGRFKDFIAMPKLNMYQSVHSTVIGPYGERIEIQIRTREMHKVAEEGFAAHWKYKEGKKLDKKADEKFAWVRQLVEWQQDLKDPREFLETVKIDLFHDEVYVFTPRGDVKQFPKGSTPVDFAYSIHTDVGHQCVGAKVDGKLVNLKYQLQSGDTVEIVTRNDQNPTEDWLKFVKTSRAKTKIRSYINLKEREKSILIGKEICEREFKKFHLNYSKLVKSSELERTAKEFSFQSLEDLVAAVGFGKISPRQIAGKLLPREELATKISDETELEKARRMISEEAGSGIMIEGVDNVLVHFGKCCRPLPGDEIVGFITRGKGITVHTPDCSNLLGVDPQRKVEARWEVGSKILHSIEVNVICENRPGLLAAICNSFGSMGINISDIEVYTTDDQEAICKFLIQIKDRTQLDKVLASIRKIKMVKSAKRIRSG